jgi:NAD(P)-dependent dehydrogenase (short-subunit alcohol dehydrogenase family)
MLVLTTFLRHDEWRCKVVTLNGKRVVVLGGTSGIGLAVAEAAMREGAEVVVASSQQGRVDAALAHLGARAKGFAVQLCDETSVRTFFSQLGQFEHLIYTAGDSVLKSPIREVDLEAAKHFFDVRLWGALLSVKHGSAQIRSGGSIVLTSSTVPRRPPVGYAVGAAVSASIEGFMRAIAVELAPIRVNCVAPGVVRTPIWDRLAAEQREGFFKAYGEALPVGRVGNPDEVAEAYLSFMRGAYTTGQVMVVDGGMLLK